MYYKVVNRDMSSAFINSGLVYDSENLNVYYKINDWAYPKLPGSKLMVFDSIKNARIFRYELCWGNNIYTCEVKNPSKNGIFVLSDYNMYKKLLDVLTKKRQKKKFSNLLHDKVLPGTIFCDSVKLLELVK